MAKQQSVFANNQKAIQSQRRAYPRFDEDFEKFGPAVASFNAGWLAGDENRKEKKNAVVLKALDALAASHKGQWSKTQRKLYEAAVRVLK
jgi:hypothetical protein